MSNNEEIDGLKSGDTSRLDIPWHEKFLMKISPRLFMKICAGDLGLDYKKVDLAFKLFKDAKIHIQPMSGANGRGFIVFLDNKLSLWFNQDGNHFEYDGFEMGEYDDGKVTVFDGMER